MFLPAELMPEVIMLACNLHNKIHNSKTRIESKKDIYGLKEASALANQ